MKKFLFFTKEGFTFDPNHKELHNMQILGDGTGDDVLEAFVNFKRYQDYLVDFTRSFQPFHKHVSTFSTVNQAVKL